MNKAPTAAPWYAPWRNARPMEQDPADLGTAFGLDLSLNELYAEPIEEPEPARRGWIQRLARRRPSA